MLSKKSRHNSALSLSLSQRSGKSQDGTRTSTALNNFKIDILEIFLFLDMSVKESEGATRNCE
jgi:hypothetical protein